MPKFLIGFCSDRSHKRATKFEVRSFTHSWDNMEYSKNWAVPRYAHAPFSAKFFMGFGLDGSMNVSAKFAVRSFTRSWDNSDYSFGLGFAVANPKSWRRGSHRGSGMVPFERASVSSYRPSIVTFHLSSRVSEISPLFCSSTPLFPTPPLVSQNFPMFPWE